MKTLQTINIILVFMFINVSYGQVYKFDKIMNSRFSTVFFPNQEWTNIFNSKDYSYHMDIYSQNDSLKSRIYDTKESQIHYFYIEKSDSLKLKFLQTASITKTTSDSMINTTKDYAFEFSEIKTKQNKKKVLFKILNKKKKRIAKYKFTIKETDRNFFTAFKLSAMETLLFTKIVQPYNFMILKARGRNTSGVKIEYELKSIEDINFTVTIP